MLDPALRALFELLLMRREQRRTARGKPAKGAPGDPEIAAAERNLALAGSRLAPLARVARLDVLSLELTALALAPDVEPAVARALTGTRVLTRPTIELVHHLFGGAAVVSTRLSSGARLRASGLVEVIPERHEVPWPARALCAPERLIEYVLAAPSMTSAALGNARWLDADELDGPAAADPGADEDDEVDVLGGDGPLVVPAAWSPSELAAVARRRRAGVLTVDVDGLGGAADPTAWARAWTVETSLRPSITVFTGLDAERPGRDTAAGWRELRRRAELFGRPLVLVGDAIPDWLARELRVVPSPQWIGGSRTSTSTWR